MAISRVVIPKSLVLNSPGTIREDSGKPLNRPFSIYKIQPKTIRFPVFHTLYEKRKWQSVMPGINLNQSMLRLHSVLNVRSLNNTSTESVRQPFIYNFYSAFWGGLWTGSVGVLCGPVHR